MAMRYGLPRSIPMTWPLIFSSPPVAPVEAYRESIDEAGCRVLENLEMGELRGSYRILDTDRDNDTMSKSKRDILTARANLETSMVKSC
jgi:hypothetical protein